MRRAVLAVRRAGAAAEAGGARTHGYHSTKNYQHLIMASNFFPQRTFLTISLIGFLIYLIFTVYQKDENFHSGLFNNLAKFHFLPLFLVSSLFIIGEAFNTQNFTKELEGNYLITFIMNCFFFFSWPGPIIYYLY